MTCFLYSDGNQEFYDTLDTYHHLTLRRGQILMSTAIIAKANLKKFEIDFLTKVWQAAVEDAEWVRRKEELEYMEKEGKELPKQWTISDNLLYYKNRLYIPADKDLQTLIAKGCHESQVAGHFGRNKTLEIITRDFYWKGLTNWVNDYVRSCTTCQQMKSPRQARFGLLHPLQVPFAA